MKKSNQGRNQPWKELSQRRNQVRKNQLLNIKINHGKNLARKKSAMEKSSIEQKNQL